MKFSPFDWRTLRLCEPDQALLLSRTLVGGIPLILAALILGLALHAFILAMFLVPAYAIVVTFLALRLVTSVKRTLTNLDEEQDQAAQWRPVGMGPEDRGEQLEHRINLAIVQLDEFRARHSRPLSFLAVVLVFALIGVAGWAVVSLRSNGGGALPPATFIEGPSVTRTFDVSGLAASEIRGGTGMLDSGIVLRGKTPVMLQATGTMSCVSTYSWCTVGPAGDSTFVTTRAGEFPLPGAPAWGLIAQVGTGPFQFIGPGATVTGSGKLYLGVNDNYPKDNLGSFSVTATFSCALVTATPVTTAENACEPRP